MGAIPASTTTGSPRQDLAPVTTFQQLMESFKGLQLLPARYSAEFTAMYPKFSAAALAYKAPSTKRAPSAPRSRFDMPFDTTSVELKEYSIETPNDRFQAQKNMAWFDPDALARDACLKVILRDIESDIATLLQDNATLLTGAATASWAVAANAKPITDSVTAALAIKAKTGQLPNVAVIPDETYRKAWLSAEIRSAISSAGVYGRYIETEPNQEAMARLLNVKRVVVPDAMYNSANPGATASMASIWDKTKVSYLIIDEDTNPSGLPNPSIGHTLMCSNAYGIPLDGLTEEQVAGLDDIFRIFEYSENRNSAKIIGAIAWCKPYVAIPEAGYVLTGANA